MNCNVCGAEVNEDDILCPECGVILDESTDKIAVIN